mgnify:FL=1
MTGGFLRILFCICIAIFANAQSSSNAYLLEWNSPTSSIFELSRLDLLTGFNTNGYNNQPFYDGQRLYLSSSWKKQKSNLTDLIALDLYNNTIRRITNTNESEYSPIRIGPSLFFIRMNPENKFQELWKLENQTVSKVIPETNVAYYFPITPQRLAVVLIESNQLNLYDIDLVTNEKKKISENAGRALAYGQNGVLYFVHKYNDETWYIKSYDILTAQIKIVCKTIPGAEDFYLSDSRYLWMAKDNRIYRTTIQNGLASSWKNIFHLENYPLNNIGRICVIGENQLVIINH